MASARGARLRRFDVADRIITRWKENLAKLNAEDPGMIEGSAIDVTPGRNE